MTEERILVTVGIPVYNMSDSIVAAVNSCINQSYKNIEILIVDDGSTDDSIEKLRNEIKDNRIRIHLREKNGGVSQAMRTIVDEAKGEYLCFLDADDTMMSDRVEKQLNSIVSIQKRHPNRMVASFCGSVVNDLYNKTRYELYPEDLWNRRATHRFGGGTGHSMYKTIDLRRLGNFDPAFSRSSDTAMCLTFLMNGGIYAMMRECLITYNLSFDETKRQVAKREGFLFEKIAAEIRLLGLNNFYLNRFLEGYEPKKKFVCKLFNKIPVISLIKDREVVRIKLFGLPLIKIEVRDE